LLLGFHHLGDSERAGKHTIAASNAARFKGRVDNSIVPFLDGVRRTDLSTGRLVAMPANVRSRRDALATLDEIKVDHRLSAMSLAFLAGLETGAASDAARWVNIELVPEH
jgi:hypothetical protein